MMLNRIFLVCKESHFAKQVLESQQGANTFIEGVFVANHNVNSPGGTMEGVNFALSNKILQMKIDLKSVVLRLSSLIFIQ